MYLVKQDLTIHIPQEGLSRIEKGRKRQGLVPDFLVEVSKEGGQKQLELAELKMISCCPTRYNMSPAPASNRPFMRAVDRRAKGLTVEYIKKAVHVDRAYGGAGEGEIGRVKRKLEEYGEVRGLVFGAFGEASEDVHKLVHILASGRVKKVELQKGRECSKGDLGVIVGQVRRMLSVVAVRAQAECLLSRMMSVGEGVVEASRRRKSVAMWQRRGAMELEAQRVGRR